MDDGWSGRREQHERGRNTGGITWLFGQMIRLPFVALVYGVEVFARTVQEMQRIADQGLEVIGGAEGDGERPESRREGCGCSRAPDVARGDDDGTTTAPTTTTPASTDGSAATATIRELRQEIRDMDKDLRDDMLKLVRYKVLFVKREYEHAFPEREDLVSDNLDAAAFTAWKVAEFIQELGRGQTPVPRKWGEKGYPSQEHRRGGALVGLDEGDKKYLRVYYEVLERYPREKFKFEEQQIRVLEQIRDAIDEKQS